jgi:GTPase
VDLCPKNILEATLQQLVKVLKSAGCRKIPMFINSMDDVLHVSGNFVSERICPIFQVSNVSGYGLDLLKMFLNVLQNHSADKYDSTQPFEYHITDTFSVPGGIYVLLKQKSERLSLERLLLELFMLETRFY